MRRLPLLASLALGIVALSCSGFVATDADGNQRVLGERVIAPK